MLSGVFDALQEPLSNVDAQLPTKDFTMPKKVDWSYHRRG